MAEHVGIVVERLNNRFAKVAADRRGGCGGCSHNGGGCRSCLSGSAKLISEVSNPVDAKVGDLVKIRLSSSRVFAVAAFLYLLPVAGLIAGAFTGFWAYAPPGSLEEAGAVIGAAVGLAAGFGILAIVDRKAGMGEKWRPAIVGVIRSGVGLPRPMPESPGRPSCCR